MQGNGARFLMFTAGFVVLFYVLWLIDTVTA